MIDLERWKFDIRQAMLDYGSAFARKDDEAIRASSEAGCALVDRLPQLVAEEAAKIAERSESRHHCAAAIREAFGIAKP